MGKVILLCGKICSGKSYYSNLIKDKVNAVVLSIDELTYYMFDNRDGEDYTDLATRATNYFKAKTLELLKNDVNVILDMGLWTKESRKEIKNYFNKKGVKAEIHYICIDDESWQKNIEERNTRIDNGNRGMDFYVTQTLKDKMSKYWEEPTKEEYDVIYKVDRTKNS